ncbi:MAG: IS200/IS605 family accessory protein TnpB-related protein, partial [Bacilli bacterium]|nr:IS200/IS605 family accessory protein TnpB-related protein [Bacilli bacterium]
MNKKVVKRVSKYNINSNHSLFDYCDNETFKAKNLRNLANYHIRQCFILSSKEEFSKEQELYLKDINNAIDRFNDKKKSLFYEKKPKKIEKAKLELEELKNNKHNSKKYKDELEKKETSLEKLIASEYKPHKYINSQNGLITYDFLDFYFSNYLESEDNPYKMLPIQTSQQVLRTLFKDWKSFFVAIKDYNKNKSKYKGRPKLPKYKEKNGRCKLSMTNQSCKVKEGYLILPKTNLKLVIGVDTSNLKLKEVRIVPMGSVYKMELVWDKEVYNNVKLNKNAYIGIDLGLSNLATITNNIGLKPIIINGKPLKSINQYYNKKKSQMQKDMPFYTYARYNRSKNININEKRQLSYSKKMDELTRKRNNKIEDYMHKASALVIKYCLENSIGNIVIGKNEQWKSDINIGKKNNQNFVSIPFNKFIEMIQYKAETYDITVNTIEESYTSKSSFLDFDEIPIFKEGKKHTFSGKRIKRG